MTLSLTRVSPMEGLSELESYALGLIHPEGIIIAEIVEYVNEKGMVTVNELREKFPEEHIEEALENGILIMPIDNGGQFITTKYLIDQNKDKYGTWKFKKGKRSAVFHETGTLSGAIYFVVSTSDKPLTSSEISSRLGGVQIRSGLRDLRGRNKVEIKRGKNKIGYFIADDEEIKNRQESAWKETKEEERQRRKAYALIFRDTGIGNDRLRDLHKSEIGMRIAEHLHKNPHLSHTSEIKTGLGAKTNGEGSGIDRVLKWMVEEGFLEKDRTGRENAYKLRFNPEDEIPDHLKMVKTVLDALPQMMQRERTPTDLTSIVFDSAREVVSDVLIEEGLWDDVSEEDLEEVIQTTSPTARYEGRPPKDTQPMFRASVLRWLMHMDSWDDLEMRLKRNLKLAEICGFDEDEIPDSTTFSTFWKEMGADPVEDVYLRQVKELAKRGVIKGKIISMDSTLIAGFEDDFGAKWGFSTTKGWVFGYKIHMVVDAEQEIPLGFIITSGNKSDMDYFIPLVDKAKELGIDFEIVLADKGYDKERHYRYAESAGAIPIIALNPRRSKQLKEAFHPKQTWLGKWINGMDAKSDPVEIFKRNPRVTCLIPRNSEEWKEYRKMRVSSERVFSRVKTYSPRAMFYGLERITVHVTLICITMCAIASASDTLGVPELMRSSTWPGI